MGPLESLRRKGNGRDEEDYGGGSSSYSSRYSFSSPRSEPKNFTSSQITIPSAPTHGHPDENFNPEVGVDANSKEQAKLRSNSHGTNRSGQSVRSNRYKDGRNNHEYANRNHKRGRDSRHRSRSKSHSRDKKRSRREKSHDSSKYHKGTSKLAKQRYYQ